MDRQIVYPGSIPLDTDLLSVQRNTMVALGYLAQATLGQTTIADGLVCAPTQPASMSVSVGPGSLTQLGSLDTLPFGSLPAEPTFPLVRLGVNLTAANFALSAPAVAGQVINYLIEASLLETDATPVVLPYYNAANPSQPYSGPGNTGAPQMTQRLQSVQLQLKAGPAVASGTAAVPAVDAGWVGLYVVTVGYGQTSVVGSNISVIPMAPFVPWKLPQLSPGTRNLAVFQPTTQGTWTAPAGVFAVKLRLWGGGGAGGSGFGSGGGGGSGAGYSEGYYPVVPGQSFYVTVGNGGAGSGSGGTSKFGNLAQATGGQAGGNGSSGAGGAGAAAGGSGSGLGFSRSGDAGGDAFSGGGGWLSGPGGGTQAGGGAFGVAGSSSGASANGHAASSPGGGGSGGVGSGVGGQGGPGLVLVEW